MRRGSSRTPIRGVRQGRLGYESNKQPAREESGKQDTVAAEFSKPPTSPTRTPQTPSPPTSPLTFCNFFVPHVTRDRWVFSLFASNHWKFSSPSADKSTTWTPHDVYSAKKTTKQYSSASSRPVFVLHMKGATPHACPERTLSCQMPDSSDGSGSKALPGRLQTRATLSICATSGLSCQHWQVKIFGVSCRLIRVSRRRVGPIRSLYRDLRHAVVEIRDQQRLGALSL